jgi:hypothetical protein
MSGWLHFGQHYLNIVLFDNEHAEIENKSDEKIRFWNEEFAAKYPDLDNIYLAVDGLKLQLQKPGDDRVQIYFYNGLTSDHYISNLFAFIPDSTIPVCVLDDPGSHHDTTVANFGGLYTLLTHVFDCNGGKVVMDIAFARADYDSIMKAGQKVWLT